MQSCRKWCARAHSLQMVCLLGSSSCPKVSYLTDNTQHIVFSSLEPSLVLTYDTMVGVHSAWRIRKARMEVNALNCALCTGTMPHYVLATK